MSPSQSQTQKLRVLLVDDNFAVRKSYSLILKAIGWDVQEAASAEEAYILAAQEKFDLAMLDITMPEVDGIEFCTKLKRDLPDQIGKILIVSGILDSATAEHAREAGADCYLQKPIGFSQLKETLAGLGLNALPK